jgi:hypothetical protein
MRTILRHRHTENMVALNRRTVHLAEYRNLVISG